MTTSLRVLFIMTMTLFIAGCTPFMVPLYQVDDSHVVDRPLTKDQVKQAIMDGAENAGWRAKDLGNDKILASFNFKTHAVNVEIDYTDSSYATRYESSYWMKMFCSKQDMKKYQNMIVSGRKDCPGNRPPSYIHKSYKQWMDSLNAAIQNSLASI